MDHGIIKKRLDTYRMDGGRFSKVSDEVVVDILKSWESWTGKGNDFAKEIGINRHQLGIFIKKGRKLIKSGKYSEGEFKELKLDNLVSVGSSNLSGSIEVGWENGRVIRFFQVEQLIDFLKKVS